MAFTRKMATKKSVAPARASYARKKKEEEVQEQEEIIEETEEVQDDYQEEAEEQEAAPRKSFNQNQTRTQSTSYGNHSARGNSSPRPSNGPGGERKALRLTGLFAGKREGLFSGRLRDEDAQNLKDLIEEAQSQGQQISFFLWENQGNPQFSLTANIAAPKSFGGGNRGGGGNRFGGNRFSR